MSYKVTGLRSWNINAEDFESTVRFYQDVLGAEEAMRHQVAGANVVRQAREHRFRPLRRQGRSPGWRLLRVCLRPLRQPYRALYRPSVSVCFRCALLHHRNLTYAA